MPRNLTYRALVCPFRKTLGEYRYAHVPNVNFVANIYQVFSILFRDYEIRLKGYWRHLSEFYTLSKYFICSSKNRTILVNAEDECVRV